MLTGMKADSLDLREKLLRACDQPIGSQRAIAALFGVSPSFVEKRRRRRRATGAIAARPPAGGRRPLGDDSALARLRRLVQTAPDATVAEFCEQLYAQGGVRVRVPTRARRARQLTLPRNKSRATPASVTRPASTRRG
jgi:transposase